MGIQPDVILCRSDYPVTRRRATRSRSSATSSGAPSCPVPTVRSIYEVPALLEDAGLGDYVIERLALEAQPRDLAEWRRFVERVLHPHASVRSPSSASTSSCTTPTSRSRKR